MDSLTLEIPLRITVSLGSQTTPALSAEPNKIEVEAGNGLERVRQVGEYKGRKGYDPEFLGMKLPLPTLTDEQFRNAARVATANGGNPADKSSALLNYEHFSIVMNRRRQLALYTAVNIDGASSIDIIREQDSWAYDPRIAESEQIGESLYRRNKLDRGHLVRRLDPVWGTPEAAARANEDTFHFTNCSPQHEGFNQNDETWQGIENFLLDSARNNRRRLTVFTGPVMTERDPIYRGVRIPLRFWKIAIAKKNTEKLTVTAYLLDQEKLISAGLERFDASIYQVKVAQIQRRTGIDLAYLSPLEVSLKGGPGLERAEEGMEQIQLNSLDQIVSE
jgi:endonuclease G